MAFISGKSFNRENGHLQADFYPFGWHSWYVLNIQNPSQVLFFAGKVAFISGKSELGGVNFLQGSLVKWYWGVLSISDNYNSFSDFGILSATFTRILENCLEGCFLSNVVFFNFSNVREVSSDGGLRIRLEVLEVLDFDAREEEDTSTESNTSGRKLPATSSG